MGFLISTLSFIAILGIMIFLHELGHFLVARYFKIKVDTFSLGFGKRLCGFVRDGVDYRLSLIPLGGYVKMAGEHYGEDRSCGPDEFLSRPRYQRALVTVAGPLMNLLLAVFLLWVNYMVGVEVPGFYHEPPRVGYVAEGSPASGAGLESGDEIVSVGGQSVKTWTDFMMASLNGANQKTPVSFRRGGGTLMATIPFGETFTDPSEISGILPFIPARVLSLQSGMPAEKAGIRKGDLVESVWDGRRSARGFIEISRMIYRSAGDATMSALASLVRAQAFLRAAPPPVSPMAAAATGVFSALAGSFEARTLRLAVVRGGGERFSVDVVPVIAKDGSGRGVIGFTPDFNPVAERYGAFDALDKSIRDNISFVVMTYRVLGKVFAGQLSFRQFSGPIGIARASGDAVRTRNVVVIFNFMALISMNLAVLNLLPIPVLDGGSLFFLLLEMAFRRDIPLRFKEKAVQAGMLLLLTFMAVVVFFDIVKSFR